MSHESSLRSSSRLLTAATAILSVLAVMSGLKLASAKIPWLTTVLSGSRVSSANQQLQGKFSEFCAGTVQPRGPVVHSAEQHVPAQKPIALRPPSRQTSIPFTHSTPTVISSQRSLPAFSSGAPQVSVPVSVPVTINVHNGELLSELRRVQQQVTELADRRQSVAVSTQAESNDESPFQYEIHRELISATDHETAEAPEAAVEERVAEVSTPTPLSEPELRQESNRLFAVPVEAPSVNPIDEPQPSSESSLPLIPGIPVEPPTEEFPVLPNGTARTNDAGPSNPESAAIVPVTAKELLQAPVSTVPPVPYSDSASESSQYENPLVPQEQEPFQATLVDEANSAGVAPDRNRVAALPPDRDFAEPVVPSAEVSASVAPVGSGSGTSHSSGIVCCPGTSTTGKSKHAVISGSTLNDARHQLARFLDQPPRPDFETPEWVDDLDASEPLERIRHLPVMHRITSSIRFAARPKTVD